MDADNLVQTISTLGFPIVAYLLVYLDLRKQMEKLTEAIAELSKKIGS